jgi:GGDEF domain-containing protein
MTPYRSGLIVWQVSSERNDSRLAEFLAEQGFDVAESLWGLAGCRPRMVITDRPSVAVRHPRLAESIHSGQTGLIQWVGSPGTRLPIEVPVDYVLPPDATGREVVLAIGLVEDILRQRHSPRAAVGDAHGQLVARQGPANLDRLTGLANREGWDQQLQERLGSGQRLTIGIVHVEFSPLPGIPVYDCDKPGILESWLREVARILRSQLRSGDFAARLSDHQWGLMLVNVDFRRAGEILQRLGRHLATELARRRCPVPAIRTSASQVPDDQPPDAEAVMATAERSLQVVGPQRR